MSDKNIIRSQCLKARMALDPAFRRQASQAICRHIIENIDNKQSIISGYRAFRGEVDVSEAMEALHKRGHMLCLPAIVNKTLVFRRWQPGEALVTGAYGIEEPEAKQPPVIPDIAIVPLVAFDAAGHRLGYGAGYYDRALAAGKNLVAIGATYAMQQVENIPALAHDQRLSAAATEKGFMAFR